MWLSYLLANLGIVHTVTQHRGLKHAARVNIKNTVDCTLNYSLRNFSAPILTRGDIFSPYMARELFFLQNVALT